MVAFLSQWQTLIGGSFALIAAVGTIGYMTIAALGLRMRRYEARRAVLPADLSEIWDYTIASVRVFYEAKQKIEHPDTASAPIKMPKLPDRVFANLQALIEHLAKRDVVAICELIRVYQIQHARLSGEVDALNGGPDMGRTRIPTERNIEHTLPATLRLHLVVSALYPFARGEVARIPPLKFAADEVDNATRVLRLMDVVSSEAVNRVKKQHDSFRTTSVTMTPIRNLRELFRTTRAS